MVAIRNEGDGKALFATEPYKYGDLILENEAPLLSIASASTNFAYAGDIEPFMRTLKTEVYKLPEEKHAALLSLFCPSTLNTKSSRLYIRQGIAINYDTVISTAQIICSNNEEEAQELAKLFYIWRFNATQYQGTNEAVFEIHARINHSCSPNAQFYAGSVRAVKAISQDELITISYLRSDILIASTRIRRQRLALSYRFHCECSRCVKDVDFSRIMRCAGCNRCSAVWGLSLDVTETHLEKDFVASCILCNTTHDRASMPLEAEASLEDEVEPLLDLTSVSVPLIHDLQDRILKRLGGNHWTAAALMKLRYDNDPMLNAFIVMQWGEANAVWKKLAMADNPWLYYTMLFALGDGCKPYQTPAPGQIHIDLAGRKYWNESYEHCKKFWGEHDKDVRNMELMFARCRTMRSSVDVTVCTRRYCSNPIDDRLEVVSRMDAKHKCAACGLARYCNKQCQIADWKEHKVVCKACQSLRDLEKVRIGFQTRTQSGS